MNGPEHYAEAERLIEWERARIREDRPKTADDYAMIDLALIHAKLAIAAATADAMYAATHPDTAVDIINHAWRVVM